MDDNSCSMGHCRTHRSLTFAHFLRVLERPSVLCLSLLLRCGRGHLFAITARLTSCCVVSFVFRSPLPPFRWHSHRHRTANSTARPATFLRLSVRVRASGTNRKRIACTDGASLNRKRKIFCRLLHVTIWFKVIYHSKPSCFLFNTSTSKSRSVEWFASSCHTFRVWSGLVRVRVPQRYTRGILFLETSSCYTSQVYILKCVRQVHHHTAATHFLVARSYSKIRCSGLVV